VSTGLPVAVEGQGNIIALAVTDSLLLAAAYDGFLWRRPLSEMTPRVADSLADRFPLALGNHWEYTFWHNWSVDNDPGWSSISDTGLVHCQIVGKSDYADSVLWLFRQSRTLHRTGSNYMGVPTVDSMVVDSTSFVLVELKAGRHRLYLQRAIQTEDTARFGADYFNYAFAFWRNLDDSLSVYRYGPVDSTGIARFLFPAYSLSPAVRRVTLKKDVGLTFVQMDYASFTSFKKARFYLLSQELMDVFSRQAEARPRGFALFQNYPNPFNPTTTIRFSLPHRSHVTLTVYNTLGQKVAGLVNSTTEAGYHEVQFNAASLASGVYFYRLQAGPFVQTRSLVVLK
jgi:hypothetical protein